MENAFVGPVRQITDSAQADRSMVSLSKFLSLILRHDPGVVGIALDEHGWADIDDLIAGISKSRPITREMLGNIVEHDAKNRYSISEDGRLIRANQGHSVPVDMELKAITPPSLLFHGTSSRSVLSITESGISRMSRLYVHLSEDIDTAKDVGKRHGKPEVYAVESMRMHKDGYQFFRSENGVWLTKHVPVEYIFLL